MLIAERDKRDHAKWELSTEMTGTPHAIGDQSVHEADVLYQFLRGRFHPREVKLRFPNFANVVPSTGSRG